MRDPREITVGHCRWHRVRGMGPISQWETRDRRGMPLLVYADRSRKTVRWVLEKFTYDGRPRKVKTFSTAKAARAFANRRGMCKR